MNSTEVNKYFNYHNENIKLIKIGFEEIRSAIKFTVKKKNSTNEYIYLQSSSSNDRKKLDELLKSYFNILLGIQVSWAEESLKRLLYESDLFTDIQRNYIIEKPLDQKWLLSLKIIFSIAYDLIPTGDEICQTVNISNQRNNLGDELVDQYVELKSIISSNLVPNFSLRNKLQHGEWKNGFKPRYSKEYCPIISAKISNENIVTTTSRYTIVNTIYQMLVDLGRFKSDQFALDSISTPFEFYYDRYKKKITYEVDKIQNHQIEKFLLDIVVKEKVGIMKRSNHT